MVNKDEYISASLTVAGESVLVAHVAGLADATFSTVVRSTPDAAALTVVAHYHTRPILPICKALFRRT